MSNSSLIMSQFDMPSAVHRPDCDQVSPLFLFRLCDQAVREDAEMLCVWDANGRDLQQVSVFIRTPTILR
jgi:hypothetical protein